MAKWPIRTEDQIRKSRRRPFRQLENRRSIAGDQRDDQFRGGAQTAPRAGADSREAEHVQPLDESRAQRGRQPVHLHGGHAADHDQRGARETGRGVTGDRLIRGLFRIGSCGKSTAWTCKSGPYSVHVYHYNCGSIFCRIISLAYFIRYADHGYAGPRVILEFRSTPRILIRRGRFACRPSMPTAITAPCWRSRAGSRAAFSAPESRIIATNRPLSMS